MRRIALLGLLLIGIGAWRTRIEGALVPIEVVLQQVAWVPTWYEGKRVPVRVRLVNTGRDTLWLEESGNSMIDYVVEGSDYLLAQTLGCGMVDGVRPLAPGSSWEFNGSVARDARRHALLFCLSRNRDRFRVQPRDERVVWSEPFAWPGPEVHLQLRHSRRDPHRQRSDSPGIERRYVG